MGFIPIKRCTHRIGQELLHGSGQGEKSPLRFSCARIDRDGRLDVVRRRDEPQDCHELTKLIGSRPALLALDVAESIDSG